MSHLNRKGPYLSEQTFWRLTLRYLLCFNLLLSVLVGKVVVGPILRGLIP